MREIPQSQLINPDGSISLPRGRPSAFDIARNLYEYGLSTLVGAGTDLFKAAVTASVPRKDGALYGIYELLAKGVFTGYEYLCPSAVERAQREQLEKLIAAELVPTYQLTEEQILMIEALADSAAKFSGVAIEELVKYRESFLEKPAEMSDSLGAVYFSAEQSLDLGAAGGGTGGKRKRKHHNTRSSTSSKSSKSGTRKHGKGKSKRAKKSGAKTHHMRLAPGAGRRTRKHSKRGRK